MNDWTRDCSTCKYASCPAPDACYCAMEREAAEDVRNSMRMLTIIGLYAAALAVAVAITYLLT